MYQTTNLLDLIQRESGATFKRQTAKEYSSACPFCRAGNDRFRVWPLENRYWCRICGRKGDAIQFLRDYKHLPFAQAQAAAGVVAAEPAARAAQRAGVQDDELRAPLAAWLEPARQFVMECYKRLYADEGRRALTWLHGRSLQTAILYDNGIGLNPVDRYFDRESWGLEPATREDGTPKPLWLPKGVVIPWFYERELWGIRVRRPAGEPKYFWVPGGVMGMYGASTIRAGWPVVLVEGELDALTIRQALRKPTAAVVATGSTNGGRRLRWLARLASASRVLVAYDADDAGETAAKFWLDALPNARRWRPFWHDANDMARDGADLCAWILAGLVR